MKYKILLYGLIAATITSCSSAYKASQTPDDVYYSPARQASVAKESKQRDRYEEYVTSEDDQYLRMKIRNRQRWSTIDDYSYWNDSRYTSPYYSYNSWNTWNSWYSPFTLNTWNSPFYPSYSPYYNGYGNGYSSYYYPKYGGYGGYSPYNSNVYIIKNPTRVNSNVSRPNMNSYNNRSYNNTNNTERFGSTLKRVFSTENTSTYSNRNSSSNNNSSYSAPVRTYSPPASSGSSSSGSSSGSSGGGVTRPGRN
jgi:hypothetical protein